MLYGEGLGGIVLVERKADTSGSGGNQLSSLPTVSLNGLSAHELTTRLGTVLEWRGRHQLRPRGLAACGRRRGSRASRQVSGAAPVETRGLVKRYGEIVAVDHVDLTVEPAATSSCLRRSVFPLRRQGRHL